MTNKRPIAVKAKKDGFMSDGGQFSKKGETYPITKIDCDLSLNKYFSVHTLASDDHLWYFEEPDFNDYFEIIYGEHEEPKIDLQVDKVELGLLFKLVNGNSLSPAEKRELYDLRSHIEKLLHLMDKEILCTT